MKQKELTEAIRQGLNLSRNDFGWELAKALIGICIFLLIIAFVGMPLYNHFQNYRCEKNPESCLSVISTQPIQRCEIEILDCYVVDKSLMKYSNKSGGGALPIIKEERDLCGYQEANAWFEQYKQQINKFDNLYLECH